ncbi:MAG: 8-amino-7-oxononanoate synthase [Parachlamydiaceae bacterium]|nr:8-amino-7-oxononanoate synthase [Parachlamydiaceae bacterium]
MTGIQEALQLQLNKRRCKHTLRTLCIPNKHLIDFASNDYLGLARSQTLKQNWFQACHSYSNGMGSTGSRLLTGNSSLATNLEQAIAAYHGFEAGLLFSNGYMANIGLLSSVTTSQDVIFYDLYSHASIYDGLKLSVSTAFPFRHNDLNHLEKRLQGSKRYSQRFVCVESIYSIDGSIAPLSDIAQLCAQYHANLIVDEAHAIGVIAPQGRGFSALEKLQPFVFAQVCTFGKALGVHGAIVLGSQTVKDYLINFSRSQIYTTALPTKNLTAIKSAYDLLPTLELERQQLQRLIHYFCTFGITDSTSHIQCLPMRDEKTAKKAAQKLATHGFDVRPLLPPTVPKACLRICLHSFNTILEIEQLIKRISSL